MIAERALVEQIEPRVTAMAAADSPSAVFRVLLEGLALCAPRVGVYLVRKGELRGWASAGYEESAAERFRRLALTVGSGWPGRLADPDEVPASVRRGAEDEPGPQFGQPQSDDCHGYAVQVGGRTLAVVIAERDRDQEPWSAAAARLLVETAQIRLELDLARRKLHRLAASMEERDADDETPESAPAEATAEDSPPTTDDAEMEPDEEPVSATDAEVPLTASASTGIDPDDPTRSAAMRFAKLVATDIRLYNEETILAGRQQGDLFDRVRDHLERGRETFEKRFPDLGPDGLSILRDAYVQVLAGGDEGLIPDDARF